MFAVLSICHPTEMYDTVSRGTLFHLSLLWRRDLDGPDPSVRCHTYVEDCEVCCNPLEISYTVEDDSLTHFEAKSLE